RRVDARDRQARPSSGGSPPAGGRWSDAPLGRSAAMSNASPAERSGATPVPMVPRFAWSPKYADFPLPFPGSEAAGRPVDVRTAPVTAIPGAGQPFAWQKVLPVAALALAILAFGYYVLAGRGD